MIVRYRKACIAKQEFGHRKKLTSKTVTGAACVYRGGGTCHRKIHFKKKEFRAFEVTRMKRFSANREESSANQP